MHDLICAAIVKRELLEFDYNGLHRVVAPYCHGAINGREVLRAIQVRGDSRSGGWGFGKLWSLDKVRNLRLTGQSFLADDPQFNPNDSAMTQVHCAVRR